MPTTHTLLLQMDAPRAAGYKSPTQQARVVTEDWVGNELYCVNCGRRGLEYKGEKALDFVCENCQEQYELKSRKGEFRGKVVDSAYDVKVAKIRARKNPSFLFLQYDHPAWRVVNLFALPRHVFSPDVVEKRKPLSQRAIRAGWVGSEILLDRLPLEARVYVVRGGTVVPQIEVLGRWASLSAFGKVQPHLRGWTLDVWDQIAKLGKKEFTLSEIYAFEDTLKRLHPYNRHVRDKIRQQMQVLRNVELLEFGGRGIYRVR